MRDFDKVRKYADKKTGIRKYDKEIFRWRVYLHLYFNHARRAEEDACLDNDLIEMRKSIEAGVNMDDLPKGIRQIQRPSSPRKQYQRG
ncbi:MAG: hypothetical protein LBP92_01845 [Deltaproteobacteria bacterium]|nr:hypothetical protein [Deltaproteobacteria bacterium]